MCGNPAWRYSRRMIFALALTAAAVWTAGTILTVVHLRRAPVAIEDETGFHVVEQPAGASAAFLPALRAG